MVKKLEDDELKEIEKIERRLQESFKKTPTASGYIKKQSLMNNDSEANKFKTDFNQKSSLVIPVEFRYSMGVNVYDLMTCAEKVLKNKGCRDYVLTHYEVVSYYFSKRQNCIELNLKIFPMYEKLMYEAYQRTNLYPEALITFRFLGRDFHD